MEDFSVDEKPCLEQTSRGFSVSYKKRFLYSKYDPQKTILSVVSSLELMEGTLVLCTSPLLCYGLKELSAKLKKDCFILALEADIALYDFTKNYFPKLENAALLPHKDIFRICEILSGEKTSDGIFLPEPGTFRRVISLDMSGGTLLNKNLYADIFSAVQNVISTFWKNRITLVRFGRLYSRNLFKNLSKLPDSYRLSNFEGKIDVPIFVFGAGESTEQTLKLISPVLLTKCFILAVDAALPILKKSGIDIDGIVAVESQLAIEKNYIGNTASSSLIFADMASRKQVASHSKKGACYFASEFSHCRFLKRLQESDFFPGFVPPLGSVGLTSVFLALKFRKNDSVPVFFTGFDFSYSLGFTHARGAFHHTKRLLDCTKLNPIENYDVAFKSTAKSFVGKNGKVIFSDANLLAYAENFSSVFRGNKNIYDCGETGLDLNIPKLSSLEAASFLEKIECSQNQEVLSPSKTGRKQEVIDFLQQEENSLKRIKELLVLGNKAEKKGISLEDELYELISCREYLFLHFPDGFCTTKEKICAIPFLKRVRSEIDFFLKDIGHALNELNAK